ncbi:MAG: TerB family tellurite resistance protein [Anaeromyxobacteraceae bacterium]
MNDAERNAILALAIHAAFADGAPADAEREQIRRVADGLAGGPSSALPSAYQSVLVEKRSVEDLAAAIPTPEARRFAYEMAVAVAEADGVRSEAERAFLDRLRGLLAVEEGPAAAMEAETRVLMTTPVEVSPAGGASPARPDAAALDARILNYAILNGALELLPESLATMAIIPLQMKLVFEVGKAHGYELDRGHVSELLATVGVGVAGQAVEQVGRKILGGILGSIGGRMLGGLGRQAASSGVAFATTYALGQVAKEYYASGRRIDAARLKAVFERLLEDARGLAGRYSGQIAEKARTIDASSLAALVKRGP